MHATKQTAPFGARDVPLGTKQGLVDGVFNRVATRYDLMNDVLSGGLHRAWKRALVIAANPPRSPGERLWNHLDVAGGTGDVAFAMLKAGGPQVRSTLLDINAAMLNVAQERRCAAGLSSGITLINGNAESLCLPAESVDLYTIAFGLRNVPRRGEALREAYRVLKRGGRYLCLEFSHPVVPVLDDAYVAFGDHIVPRLAAWFAGDAEPYRYLIESIRRFPEQEALAQELRGAGFSRVTCQNLSGGIAALHSGWKL